MVLFAERGNMTWDVTEITLEAHYLNAASDTLTLACQSISELPAEYYPDNIGADGTVMRSLKERRSLLVRGISPQDFEALDALKRAPTELSFKDLRTGKLENFRIERVYVREPGTARFAVLD